MNDDLDLTNAEREYLRGHLGFKVDRGTLIRMTGSPEWPTMPLDVRLLIRRGLGERSSPAVETGRKSGPEPMTTAAEVERARAELEKARQPSGERSIARRLGVSRDAVRYATGKDRRQAR